MTLAMISQSVKTPSEHWVWTVIVQIFHESSSMSTFTQSPSPRDGLSMLLQYDIWRLFSPDPGYSQLENAVRNWLLRSKCIKQLS